MFQEKNAYEVDLLVALPSFRSNRFQRNHWSNNNAEGQPCSPADQKKNRLQEFIAASATRTHLSPFSQSLLHRKNIRNLSTDISLAVSLLHGTHPCAKRTSGLYPLCTRYTRLSSLCTQRISLWNQAKELKKFLPLIVLWFILYYRSEDRILNRLKYTVTLLCLCVRP